MTRKSRSIAAKREYTPRFMSVKAQQLIAAFMGVGNHTRAVGPRTPRRWVSRGHASGMNGAKMVAKRQRQIARGLISPVWTKDGTHVIHYRSPWMPYGRSPGDVAGLPMAVDLDWIARSVAASMHVPKELLG